MARPELIRASSFFVKCEVYLLSLACLVMAVTCAAAQDEPRTVWDGIYTIEQAERGQGLVDEYCAVCHGKNLRGSQGAPAIAGVALLYLWDGRTLGELLETISTTIPPGQGGALTDQEYVDVLAIMLQRSDFPTGNEAGLPESREEIEHVMIRREKPE
jgi:mono/diheme cytochrome c family protein